MISRELKADLTRTNARLRRLEAEWPDLDPATRSLMRPKMRRLREARRRLIETALRAV